MYPVGQRKYRSMSYPHYLARRGKEEEWTGEIKGLWSEEAWCDLVCCDAFLPPPPVTHSLSVCVALNPHIHAMPQPNPRSHVGDLGSLACWWWWGRDKDRVTCYWQTDGWLPSFPLPSLFSISISFFLFPFSLFSLCWLSLLSITLCIALHGLVG